MPNKSDVLHRQRVDPCHENRCALSNRRCVLFNQGSIGALITDPDTGRVVDCNLKAARILGYVTAEDMIGHCRMPDHYATPLTRVDFTARLKTSGRIENIRTKFVRVDGSSAWVALSSRYLFETGYVQTVMVDITDQRAAESRCLCVSEQLAAFGDTLTSEDTALKKTLEQFRQMADNVHNSVHDNLTTTTFPIIRSLKEQIGPQHLDLIAALEQSIIDVTSSFVQKLTHLDAKLTRREVEVCALIRKGLSSKDIARALSISPQTVRKHRELIRKRLGLTKANLGLSSFLTTM